MEAVAKRQRGRSVPARRRLPGEPDDFMETPFGYVARWGNRLELRNMLTREEHEQVVTAFLSTGDELRTEQEARRERLAAVLQEADAIDLLARIGLTYLQFDPDSFAESQNDRSPAHVEYLALQVLALNSFERKEIDLRRQAQLSGEALGIVREMFQGAQMLTIHAGVEGQRAAADDPTAEYMMRTRLESLGVRGSGYAEHLEQVIHGCFDGLDKECRALLGFTASDALSLGPAVARLMSRRLEPLFDEASSFREKMFLALKRERRNRSKQPRLLPDFVLDLPPNKAKEHVSMIARMFMLRNSRSISLITPKALTEVSDVLEPAWRAILDAFACPPSAYVPIHHAYPTGAHPLTMKPLLKVDEDCYLAPVLTSMIDAVRPRMEDLLSETPLWDRYLKARGKYLENEATRLLAGAFPGSRSWVGVSWHSPRDSSDLDGLVTSDDLGLRMQCKAGRLSGASRRGAPLAMKRDIKELIENAADQHAALADALTTNDPVSLGFSSEQVRALAAPLQFEIIVCLDDVTVWATQAHELQALGALPRDRAIPWVLSVTDLMAVTDLLDGSQLAHYLVRRQRLERDGRIWAHDELDWVGNYLAEGLFFDDYFNTDEPPARHGLMSYTDDIDAWYFTRAGQRQTPAPKPSQRVPPKLASLLKRLEREQPAHWVIGAIALLDGDQDSRDLWESAIDNAESKVSEDGWSNASQGFHDRYGVTLMIDRRIPWPVIRRHVAAYCRTKADQTGCPNWVGIGEGESGGLFIVTINQDPDIGIPEVFLRPPPPTPGKP